MENTAIFTDNAVVFGILMVVLGLVFYTSGLKNKWVKKLYAVFPPLLMCYFIPGILNLLGVIDGTHSPLHDLGSDYLLPACLILFTLSLDLKELWKMRKKAGVIFLAGTLGVVIGGPVALWITSIVAPSVVVGQGADALWRGFGTLAGSWIGGSANQVALKEILNPSPDLFSSTLAVDVLMAYGWMAVLLYGITKSKYLDKFLGADSNDVKKLIEKMEQKEKKESRIPESKDLIIMFSIAFAGTGLAALVSDPVAGWFQTNYPQLSKFSLTSSYFWMILVATIIGIGLSFTKVRGLEQMGASKLGTALLYMLIVTIGMQMNILAIFNNPGFFMISFIWICIHAIIIFLVTKWTKTPFFYMVVGSMANIGGVASASVTSAAYHPSLISVGVIVGVFGYAIGTYAGWFCSLLMHWVLGG